jgi:gamma-glutamyltranspeptidase
MAEAVLQIVARGKSLAEAIAAPRMHTEGTLAIQFEKGWPESHVETLKKYGYAVTIAGSATISAAGLTNEPGKFIAAMR